MSTAPDPPEHVRAWGGDQHKDLHFAVSCAFLFYVFMCGTQIESLMGSDLPRFIQTNLVAKLGLGFLVMVFTIGFVSDMPSFGVLLAISLGVMLWFVGVSHLGASWNVAVLLCLLVSFGIHEYEVKSYGLEVVQEDTQPQKYPLAAASTGFAWTALGVSIIGGILALSKRFKHRSVAAPLPAATPLSQQLHQALNRAPDSIKKHLQPDMITEANASQYLWLLSGATS